MRKQYCRKHGLLHEGATCALCAGLASVTPDHAPIPTTAKAPKPDPQILAIVERLNLHVASVPAKYPGAWEAVNKLRALRGKELPDWPNWCFMPLAGAFSIATQLGAEANHADTAMVGAMAAWRVTKGIYRFDQTVFDELWETKITGQVPVEALYLLPEWCCYIAFPYQRWVSFCELPQEFLLYGFFVHLESDANSGRAELRFVLDYSESAKQPGVTGAFLTPIMIHLQGNLEDCVASAVDEMQKHFGAHCGMGGAITYGNPDPALVEQYQSALRQLRIYMAAAISPLVSLTLYLCSDKPEIVPRGPFRPRQIRRSKQGNILAAEQPVVWDVAYRLGATIRKVQDEWKSRKDRGGTHAGPSPHLRHPHWHAFWTGPKAKRLGEKTERRLIVKWLRLIGVKMRLDENEPIPTIHKVIK